MCLRETGRFSSGVKKAKLRLQRCARATLHQPGVDVSSVWPCNFHDKYLSIKVSSYYSRFLLIFKLEYIFVWVPSN